MEWAHSFRRDKEPPVRARAALLIAVALLAGCSRKGELSETGGVYVVRSACPPAAIPAATGDVTLFNPAGSTDAAAVDVVATLTNLRSHCTEDAANVVSTASFLVVATRRDTGAARQVILPYFDVALQGGNQVAAKRIGRIALNFAAGRNRTWAQGQTTVRINRSMTTLPADVRAELIRKRDPGDPNAAIDPMSDPKIRDAVARASFEHLVGFQLTPDQLRYNATR